MIRPGSTPNSINGGGNGTVLNPLGAVPTPTYTDGDWGFNLVGNNAVIVSYSGTGGNIIVPSTVNDGSTDRTVVGIGTGNSGETVLDNANISANSTLTLPNTLTYIKEYAFQNCTNITGNLTIPDTCQSINDYAFYGCTGLTGSLDLSHVNNKLGNSAFANCSGFNGSITLPSTTVYDGCFKRTGFTSIIWPSGTITLRSDTFTYSSLTGTLTIPANVKMNSSSNNHFSNCDGLTEVIWNSPSDINYIDFAYCSNIHTFTMNSGNNISGREAFRNCTSLENITLSPTLKSIGYDTFNGCSSLESITIPDSVKKLGTLPYEGNGMFYNCTSLVEINISDNSQLETIGYRVFSGVKATNINIPSGVKEIGAYAFSDSYIESFTAPTNLTSHTLLDGCFTNCSRLKNVNLNSITTLGQVSGYTGVFSGCTALEKIIIPESMVEIKNNAFENCTNLNDVIVVGSPTISSNAFTGSGVKQVLNLGDTDITTTSYGMPANAEIRQGDDAMLGCLGYVSATEYTEDARNTGAVYDALALIPILMVVGILMVSVGAFITMRK